jgi:hypothetical protein
MQVQQTPGNGNASVLQTFLKVARHQEELLDEAAGLEHYLYERYQADAQAWKRNLYYSLKPVIPRWLQLFLRRRYVGHQEVAKFPAWPIETRIVDLMQAAVQRATRLAKDDGLLGIAPWPDGHSFAFCITHDVEWDAGLRRAPDLREVELRAGMRSSWNLVPERYPIDWTIVDGLRSSGGEIGIHGLKHDGQLFRSHALFRSRLARIESYAREWQAVGFRSPSCLRNAEWMQAMNFEYDLSFPDTDPYEPQPGGCCSVWPFFLGSMVELPLTMPQDHTLYEILGHDNLQLWHQKADWIARVGGLVLINVHPDYITTDRRLMQYEEFLLHMREQPGMWHALPRDIARWWRNRAAMTLEMLDGQGTISGRDSSRARIVQWTGSTGLSPQYLD